MLPIPTTCSLKYPHFLWLFPFLSARDVSKQTTNWNLFIFSSVPDFSRLTENIPESGKDEFKVVEGSVYLYFPERFGDTKYSNAFFEKRLASAATTRNWKTMITLLGMCDEYNDKPSRKS